MKKVFGKLVVMLLVVAMCMTAFAGCGEAKSADEFLIGGSGPLTGDAASYGISVKQGADIAIAEINAAGGINGFQVKFQMEDDMADGEKSGNITQQLVDDGMHAFMGSVTTGSSLEAGEITMENNVFQITPSASAAACAQYDNQFRVCFTDPLQGRIAAQFLAKNFPSITKVGALYDSSDAYSQGIYEAFAGEIGSNITLTTETFIATSATDYSAQIRSFINAGCEFVFLPFYYTQAAAVLTQAADLGLEAEFMGCDGLDGILGKIADPATAEGLFYLTPFLASSTDPATAAFVSAYKEAYNESPDQFAADGYDAIYAIKTAMEKADVDPSMSASDICEAMKTAMVQITVPGLTGSTTWSADGEPTKDALIVEVSNGAIAPFAG